MADYFVFDIVNSLLGKIATYAYEEVSQAYGLYEDVQGIKDTLSIVKGVLLDAEEKKEHNQALREWLRQIQNVCTDAEDVLDGFEYQSSRKQVVKASGSIRVKVDHFFSSSNSLVFRLRMAHQINDVRERLDKIAADGNKFGLERIDVDNRLVQRREMTHSHVDASDVVGRESDRDEIIKLLMQSHPDGDKSLSPQNCLSLFVRWAFKDGQEKQHPDLMEIGKEIVKKCRGVPLAVRTLGTSLFSASDIEKWEFVRDHEIWNLKQKREDILPALKLSYDQMPFHLKHCFAYFSLFPKDFRFINTEITNLWASLGLLQSPDGSQKVDKIARQYIEELHSRSFLQDFTDYGLFYFFNVHDLVHDLALYVAKEEFLMVDSRTQRIAEQVRHLSIVETDSLDHTLFPKSKSLRTIIFPVEGVGLARETLLQTWLSRYRYLRILDLSDSSFETLPNIISKLVHLRVLDLSNNRQIKKLPHSIGKLQNLQVFSVSGCMQLEALPKGLGMLKKLRELKITTKQSFLSQEEVAKLSNLQTLSFEYCVNLKFLLEKEQLAQLSSLQILVVRSCGSLESLPFYILTKLEALFVADCEKLNLFLDEEAQTLRMKFLHVENFPWLTRLPTWIEGAADTLQTLIIYNLSILCLLPECLPEMTHLKRLHISECPSLLFPSTHMHRLTTIEDLSIEGFLAYTSEYRICGSTRGIDVIVVIVDSSMRLRGVSARVCSERRRVSFSFEACVCDQGI
ncbi:disease resistance protein RPM1 [Vigna unguiculata]|uniref:Disease resistance protein RPM1 n=1 Tax=Vigna unguiculata TaxID=3917 RepID=A0A4D6M7U2_VIGUN|nr:disease resistance protein RPM1 [Vigna unguiculata]